MLKSVVAGPSVGVEQDVTASREQTMAKLVENQEMYDFLDITTDDDPNGVVPKIRDSVESLLEQQTNQVFGASEQLEDEMYDGTGLHFIYTRRPIDTLAGISFLYMAEIQQDAIYALDILNGVTFRPGTRRIMSRLVRFPDGRDNVLISYTTSANQPSTAILAVQEAVAMVYRTRGSEDARSEQKGTFQHVLLRKMEELRFWSKAVESLQVPSIG